MSINPTTNRSHRIKSVSFDIPDELISTDKETTIDNFCKPICAEIVIEMLASNSFSNSPPEIEQINWTLHKICAIKGIKPNVFQAVFLSRKSKEETNEGICNGSFASSESIGSAIEHKGVQQITTPKLRAEEIRFIELYNKLSASIEEIEAEEFPTFQLPTESETNSTIAPKKIFLEKRRREAFLSELSQKPSWKSKIDNLKNRGIIS